MALKRQPFCIILPSSRIFFSNCNRKRAALISHLTIQSITTFTSATNIKSIKSAAITFGPVNSVRIRRVWRITLSRWYEWSPRISAAIYRWLHICTSRVINNVQPPTHTRSTRDNEPESNERCSHRKQNVTIANCRRTTARCTVTLSSGEAQEATRLELHKFIRREGRWNLQCNKPRDISEAGVLKRVKLK